jgi:hypothetical protein
MDSTSVKREASNQWSAFVLQLQSPGVGMTLISLQMEAWLEKSEK